MLSHGYVSSAAELVCPLHRSLAARRPSLSLRRRHPWATYAHGKMWLHALQLQLYQLRGMMMRRAV